MKLSLSVRIAEAPCKTRLHFPLRELLPFVADLGCQALCLRASAAGVQTPREQRQQMAAEIQRAGLAVSMVTADFDVPLNNDNGPGSLRNIKPSLDVADDFGCDLIRVCLKKDEDIDWARRAADLAAQRHIRLAHQCHTASLFEEVERSIDVLQRIGRENFGLIYEPANLMLCGQSYGAKTLRRLQPWLMNVYVQNHALDSRGPLELPTYCLGPRRFRQLPLWEPGGVDFGAVFSALKAIGYEGYVTVHQAENTPSVSAARQYAARCANWFREMARS